MRVHLLFPLTVALGASGCGLILDFDPYAFDGVADAGGIDARFDAAGAADTGADADAAPPDTGPSRDAMADARRDADTGMRDGASDGAADGGDADLDAGDSGPDDAGEDAEPADADTDAEPVSPIGCASGTVDEAYPSGDMVGCDGALDQCTAETLCGAGWHLCTWSEFTDRGGAGLLSATTRWLAACARLPGTCEVPDRPTDAICAPSCSRSGEVVARIGHWCAGGFDDEGDCPLGIVTNVTSRTISFGTTTACVQARPEWTTNGFGATCCR